jgi:hypothetical protein
LDPIYKGWWKKRLTAIKNRLLDECRDFVEKEAIDLDVMFDRVGGIYRIEPN